MKATVDRIEGDWLVLVPESGPIFQIPTSLSPGLHEKEIVEILIVRDENSENESIKRINEIRKGLKKVEL
jgi:hypothetical protein